jgi:hypothetical protein
LSNYSGASAKIFYDRGLQTFSDLAIATNFTTADKNGQPGLMAEYFANNDLQGQPVLARPEPYVDFGPGTPLFPEDALFSLTGYCPRLLALRSVCANHQNWRHLPVYVDDKLVLDNWTTMTALADYRTLKLDSTPHKIVLSNTDAVSGVRPSCAWASLTDKLVNEARKLAASADVVVVAAGFIGVRGGKFRPHSISLTR